MTERLLCELKAAIAARGLTQLDVDHQAGLGEGHTGKILRGEKDPQLDTLARIADVLNSDLALAPRESKPP